MKFNKLYIAGAIIALLPLWSCKDDDGPTGDPYFTVEDFNNVELPQAGLDMHTFSAGKKFIIRANGKWQLVPEDESVFEWTNILPYEGVDDGMIRIYAEENLYAAVREARFHIYLNGADTGRILSYTQEGCAPFLNISTAELKLKRAGGEVTLTVDANFDWECSITGENASRFIATPLSDTEISVSTSEVNTSGEDLSATLEIYGKGEFSNVIRKVDIVQLCATFFDDFSWLPNPEAGILGWSANGAEVRIDSWTDEQTAHGWTSVSRWLYSRDKFVKFGKGGYGADACSPAVPEIAAGSNASISWNMLGYATAKDVKDDHNVFYVALLGPGTIKGCSATGELGHTIKYQDNGNAVTLNAVKFTLDENAWMLKSVDPTATVIWQTPSCLFNIDVEGMGGTTRVVFIAGPNSIDDLFLEPNGKNSRMFMDNFKVVVN